MKTKDGRDVTPEEHKANVKSLAAALRDTQNMMLDSIYLSDIAIGAKVLTEAQEVRGT